MGVENAFDTTLVLELGGRIGASATGNLLAQAGADVVFVEPMSGKQAGSGKLAQRENFAAGKRSLAPDLSDAGDRALLRRLAEAADIVITSDDVDPDWDDILGRDWRNDTTVCDVSAYGSSGPMAGRADSDFQIQAVTGIADTTGLEDAPPLAIAFPVVDYIAALYAFGGIAAAERTRRQQGVSQGVEIALYDCAFSTIASFLPGPISGGDEPHRLGNRHPLARPWNVYQATDDWILIATASSGHWQRLTELMDLEDLGTDPGLVDMSDRVERSDEIDIPIAAWVRKRSAKDCLDALMQAHIPCAPIAVVDGFPREANLIHRGMNQTVTNPLTGVDVVVPGAVLRSVGSRGRAPQRIPPPDADRIALNMRLAEPVQEAPKPTPAADPRRPLDGIRVIEVGQLTTGPLSGRLLGALGADVIKVEAPTGDPMRWYRPGIGKQGFFFSYYNTDKKSVAIDLKSPTGQQELRRLLGTADVLVQNLKQGALAKLGFDAAELERINPRLVSCDICGFGQDTLYAGRPALDSVVQAMSGGMDLNRVNGVPVKSGISAVDLKSALLAFGAIVAALLDRDKTGKGSAIDLSMQDVAAWTTAPFWNGNAEPTASTVIACTPGRVIAQGNTDDVANILKDTTRADGRDAHLATELPAETVAAMLSTSGITAAPLLSVSEALNASQTKARNLHFELPGSDGQMWPAVAIPMRLSHTPAISKWVIGGLDSDRQMVLPMAAE